MNNSQETKLDRESMLIRLDMLYRMLVNIETGMVGKPIPQDTQHYILSMVTSAGFGVVHSSREKDAIIYSPKGRKQAGQMVVDTINQIRDECYKIVHSGLPVTLSSPKQEIKIIESLQDLADRLIRHYETL